MKNTPIFYSLIRRICTEQTRLKIVCKCYPRKFQEIVATNPTQSIRLRFVSCNCDTERDFKGKEICRKVSMPRKSKHYSPTNTPNERVSQIYDENRAIPRKNSNTYTIKFYWSLSEPANYLYYVIASKVTMLLYREIKRKHKQLRGRGIYRTDGSLRSSIGRGSQRSFPGRQ